MTESHVTRVLDGQGRHSLPDRPDSGGPYVAICQCTWRSDPTPTREEAARAANFHRLNARVQKENL